MSKTGEVAVVENSQNEIPAPSPSRRGGEHGKHWVEKSIEDIANDYFSSNNQIAKKIILEKKKCQEQHSDWDRLDHAQKNEVMNDWFIDGSLKLRYELKLGIIEAPKPEKNFPRREVQGGMKMVTYRDEDGSNSKAKVLTWKDEFSGPFSWETKCQQELSVINGGSEPAKHESLLPELDSPTSKTKPLSPNKSPNKATKGGDGGEQHANSMMVMKDVTKRHSFGSNLLASLEERLDFDQAVGDAEAAKKINTKDYQNIGQVDAKLIHAGGESKGSPRSSAGRKSSEHNYKSSNRDGSKFKPSKPKMAPPGPGPKPRDIPKFSDPPMYHKSNKPKYTEPPKYKQVEPPSQNMDRGAPPPMQSIDRGGRPTNEPPKQPKINRPKIEPPKPKAEISKPKMQPPKSPDAIDSPQSPRTPKLDQARPKFQPPRQPSSRPSMDPPPPQPTKPSSPRRQPKREPPIDKEQLLPSLGAVGAVSKARSQTLPATPHDNVSLEIKEEKVQVSVSDDETPAASGDGEATTFDFLMAW